MNGRSGSAAGEPSRGEGGEDHDHPADDQHGAAAWEYANSLSGGDPAEPGRGRGSIGGKRAAARKAQKQVKFSAEVIRDQLRRHEKTVRARETRRREREMLETAFQARNIATLKEGQDALNIAFGAVLSAYVGNVLAALTNKAFSSTELAYFFVMIGLFITGLCIGNSVLLRGYRWLAALFLGVSFVSAYLALGAAHALGFEVPILKIMVICWVAALLTGDLVLTAIIYVHHHRSGT